MSTAINAGAWVTLPVASAAEYLTLAQAILTASREVQVASAAKARGHLEVTTTELDAALTQQLQAKAKAESVDRRFIDRKADRHLSAFESWLDGWARIEDDDPSVTAAASLYEVVFGAGLSFTQRRMQVQWAETQRRLTTLMEPKNRALVESLGGARFLHRLEILHREYGAAIGVTEEAPEAVAPVRVLEALDATRDALRDYVAKVTASVERDEPETEALATRLLRPLLDWKPTQTSRGSTSSGGAADIATPNAPGEPVPA